MSEQAQVLVLFVCWGNVYRSPVAEQLFRKLVEVAGLESQIEVRSRGIQGFRGVPPPRFPNLRYYDAEWNAAKGVLESFGVALADHVATAITPDDVREASLVVAMDEKVYSEGEINLLDAFPAERPKIRLFGEFEQSGIGIPDPDGQDDRYEHYKTVARIFAGVQEIFRQVVACLGDSTST